MLKDLKEINIAFSTKDDEYVNYMIVTMLSVVLNNKNCRLNFYILISLDFSDKSKQYIKNVFNKYKNVKIIFLEVDNSYDNVKLTHDFINLQTYYRLSLPDLLPLNVNRCLYLDTDVIVNGDLINYFSLDIEDYYFAGVVAAGYLFSKEYNEKRLLLPDISTYTNAGVILMNIEKMRQDGLTSKFKELLSMNYHDQDQDILNVSCYNKILNIPLKYNLMTKYEKLWDKCVEVGAYSKSEIEEALSAPVIIHYADKIKPWDNKEILFSKLWWDYAKKTPVYKKIKKRYETKILQKLPLLKSLFSIEKTDKKRILHILFLKISIKRKQHQYNNAILFIKFLLKKKLKSKFIKPQVIHAISYAKESPNGGVGGPHAALSMMKYVLNNELNDCKIKYTFKQENKYTSIASFWAIIWGGAKTAFDISRQENNMNVLYVTQEIGSAFGLWLAGKPYILGYHAQGSFLEEQILWGNSLKSYEKRILMLIEKFAFNGAECVYTPSIGAYKYYTNSKYKLTSLNSYKFYGAIYNTLWYKEESEKNMHLNIPSNSLVFFSVGQCTKAKGIDQSVRLIESILAKTSKNIFYIVSGKGPLKDSILNTLSKLKQEYSNFGFIHFEPGLSNSEMEYLRRIADVYLMLHRISVFDLATLEMMRKGKAIVLSDVGGNPEFNVEDNIIMWSEEKENYDEVAEKVLSSDLREIGQRNKSVYDRYFGHEPYRKAYENLLLDFTSSVLK